MFIGIMADKNDKTQLNVEGKFYVDKQCIDCDLCRQMAPEFFDRNDEGMSYVKQQPASDADVASCTEAMESCPVNAIGNDGE